MCVWYTVTVTSTRITTYCSLQFTAEIFFCALLMMHLAADHYLKFRSQM